LTLGADGSSGSVQLRLPLIKTVASGGFTCYGTAIWSLLFALLLFTPLSSAVEQAPLPVVVANNNRTPGLSFAFHNPVCPRRATAYLIRHASDF
jgi:hypothetical protein